MTAALLLLLLLFAKKRDEPIVPGPSVPTPGPPVAPRATPASAPVPVAPPPGATRSQPPPWPQQIPPGLPSFPSGWEFDEPPPAAVVTRAAQLLPELWRYGNGTRKTEQTGGRWITYVASQMGSKKGVVAYRPKQPVEAPAGLSIPTTRPPVVPASYSPASPPQTAPAPAASALQLPVLKQGSRGQDVVTLQKRLGIPADGVFGKNTKAAVIAFQNKRGLLADGIVGRKTWAALLG